MKVQKYIAVLELLLMVPLIGFVVWGMIYAVPIMLYDNNTGPTVLTIFLALLFILSAGSLVSCCLLIFRYVSKGCIKITRKEKALFIFASTGAVIAIISLGSAATIGVFPQWEETAIGGIAVLAFGSPALVPYIHYYYLRANANKERN